MLVVTGSEVLGHTHDARATLPIEDVETLWETVENTEALVLRNVEESELRVGESEVLVVRDVITFSEELVPVVKENEIFGHTHVEIASRGDEVTREETVVETEGFVLKKDVEILADTLVENDELVLGAVEIAAETFVETELLVL